MLADTTDLDEISCIEHIYDGCLDDEIDLSHLDFNDNDYWLYIPTQFSTESSIKDLYAWLRMEPEIDIQNNKKNIDTRTFTRPKKRSTRMSFESIFRALPPYAKNLWRLQNPNITDTEDMGKCISIEDKESVPSMFKPSAKAAMSLLSDENAKSGEESMEAFLNMSQSKGIDSFINLDEPEFNDGLMNMSQPSVLYTSIIAPVNEATFSNNIIAITNRNIAQQSFHDNIVSPNETYRISSLNNTFCKGSIQLEEGSKTYNSTTFEKVSPSSANFDREETDVATLSSTFVTESNADVNIAQLPNIVSNKTLDTTYLSSAKNSERQNTVSNVSYKSAIHPTNKANLNVTCDISSNGIESTAFLETQAEDTLDMSFMVPIYSQSTPIHPNMLNSTSKLATNYSNQPRQISYPTLKDPTSLRRELLAEIRRSSERKLDTTYDHVLDDPSDLKHIKKNIHVVSDKDIKKKVLPENRYHTYKKSTLTMMSNEYKDQSSEYDIAATFVQKKPAMDHKFYTFTKKSNNVEKIGENTEATVVKNVADGTFCKPFPKMSKRNAPRMLSSKLPQFLRKSNPNLVSSSLKTITSIPGNPSICSVGFIKGSQPNIAQNIEKPLPSKLHAFNKLKSGSELRLLGVNVNNENEFSKDATGSVESIESTQSAHSAPDLDDRSSMCSENSQNSCNRRTMNMEQLHQLVRMQEQSLKQDLPPQLNRPILENNWIEEKSDLPSPILKNGIEHIVINANSSLDADSGMKSSSPVISPTESSHVLNKKGNLEDNIAKGKEKVAIVEKTEDPNQIVPKVENKTRLRQPTNWAVGSKPSIVTSGIPRPASRIPALRFARPSTKVIQTDIKKG